MNYHTLWKLAQPYYTRGRPGDIEHVQWLWNEIEKFCAIEPFDPEILIPLAILHDVGYAEVSDKDNPYDPAVRKEHMEKGVVIARKILDQTDIPEEKKAIIVQCIAEHDNWALDKEYSTVYGAVFNDFEFCWCFTPKGFALNKQFLKKTDHELRAMLTNELKKHTFTSAGIKTMCEHLLEDLQ